MVLGDVQLLLMLPAQLEVFFPCPFADAERHATVSEHVHVLSRQPWLVFWAEWCPWRLLICHLHRRHIAWENAHTKLQAAHAEALMRSVPYKATCGHPRTGRGRSAAVDRRCARGVSIGDLQRICCFWYVG